MNVLIFAGAFLGLFFPWFMVIAAACDLTRLRPHWQDLGFGARLMSSAVIGSTSIGYILATFVVFAVIASIWHLALWSGGLVWSLVP